MDIPAVHSGAELGKKAQPVDPQLKAAQEFEAVFISEILKHSGVNKTSQSFGGGAGEEAFSSMLTDAYATAIVDAGGIGLTEQIYRSMVEKNS